MSASRIKTPTRVAILSIHGIGAQNSEFADRFHERLEDHLTKQGFEPYFESAFWADELDGMEETLLDVVARAGGKNGPMRRLAVETLADALAYQREREIYQKVQFRVVEALDRLYAPWRRRARGGDPLFILAHSLGGMVVCDYLQTTLARDTGFGLQELRGLFTFGCNIPLFSIGRPFMPPPLRNAVWRNYWDEDDFLGYPLRGMEELQSMVRDEKVNVGSMLTWWNGLSHLGYWNDRAFAKRIASAIKEVLNTPISALPDTIPDGLRFTKH